MNIKIKYLIMPFLAIVIIYSLARAWCADHIGPLSYMAFLGSILLFVLGYFLFYNQQNVKIKINIFWILYSSYLLYVVVNLLVKSNANSYAFFEYIFYMLFLFAWLFVINTIRFDVILKAYIYIGVILGLEAIWEYRTGHILYRSSIYGEVQTMRRAYGLIGSPLTMGMVLSVISLMSIFMGMTRSKKYYLAGIITLFGLLATQSRGPMAGFAAGTVVLWYCQSIIISSNRLNAITKSTIKVLGIGLILFCMLIVLAGYNEMARSVLDRIQSMFIWGVKEKSNHLRTMRWKNALKIFSENPILGYGVSTTGSRALTGINVESGILKKLVETGIVGFVLYYLLFGVYTIKGLIKSIRLKREYTAISIAIISAIFIENIVMQIIESAGVFLLLMLAFTYIAFEKSGNEKGEQLPWTQN